MSRGAMNNPRRKAKNSRSRSSLSALMNPWIKIHGPTRPSISSMASKGDKSGLSPPATQASDSVDESPNRDGMGAFHESGFFGKLGSMSTSDVRSPILQSER